MPVSKETILAHEKERDEELALAYAALDKSQEKGIEPSVKIGFQKESNAHFDLADAKQDEIDLETRALEIETRKLASAPDGDPDKPPKLPSGDPMPDKIVIQRNKALSGLIRFGAKRLTKEARALLTPTETSDAAPPDLVRVLQVGNNALGGYVVPDDTDFGPLIIKRKAFGPMATTDKVEVVPTATGAPMPFPTIDVSNLEGADYGEDTAITFNDAAFGLVTLNSFKRGAGIPMTREFLEDNIYGARAAQMTFERIQEILARGMNKQLTVGTGIGQAQGIITASTPHVAAANNTFTADEIIDLQHSIDPAYRSPDCVFMCNDAIFKHMRKFKNTDGDYILQYPNISKGTPMMLFEQELIINQAMDVMGASKNVLFYGDMKQYARRDVNGTRLLRSDERYIEKDQIAFIAWRRYDGRALQPSALAVLKLAA